MINPDARPSMTRTMSPWLHQTSARKRSKVICSVDDTRIVEELLKRIVLLLLLKLRVDLLMILLVEFTC